MHESNLYCFSCSKKLDLNHGQKIVKNEECPYCYASLHSCRMCHYYEPQAYNQCREPNAERIVEKEKANYCDFYLVKTETGKASQNKSKSDLLAQAEALFKKKN